MGPTAGTKLGIEGLSHSLKVFVLRACEKQQEPQWELKGFPIPENVPAGRAGARQQERNWELNVGGLVGKMSIWNVGGAW